MCKSKEENKGASDIKKSLDLSLYFFPSWGGAPFSFDTITGDLVSSVYIPNTIRRNPNLTPINIMTIQKKGISSYYFNKDNLLFSEMIPYYIGIFNDNLIVRRQGRIYHDFSSEYNGKLTDEQYLEIEKKVSALTKKYDRSKNYGFPSWGCILAVNGQIYYQDNFFTLFETRPKGAPPLMPIPEEIKSLIGYIASLSPIPIDLSEQQESITPKAGPAYPLAH
jgi:hypothetical protein